MKVLGMLLGTVIAMTSVVSHAQEAKKQALEERISVVGTTQTQTTIRVDESTMVISKEAFTSRLAAKNFCKLQGAKIAAYEDIWLMGVMAEATGIGRDEAIAAVSYSLVGPEGRKYSGVIQWLDDETFEKEKQSNDLWFNEDGRGLSPETMTYDYFLEGLKEAKDVKIHLAAVCIK